MRLFAYVIVALAMVVSAGAQTAEFDYVTAIGAWKNPQTAEKITFDEFGYVMDTLQGDVRGKTSVHHEAGSNLSIFFGKTECHYAASVTSKQLFLGLRQSKGSGCGSGLFERSYRS